MVVDCGCSLLTEHDRGDRLTLCPHGRSYVVTAIANVGVRYTVRDITPVEGTGDV